MMEFVNLWKLYISALIAIPTVAQFDFHPYELFGCFDRNSAQLGPINTVTFSGSLTLGKCESCAGNSATYFGVSEGDKCWCFMSHDRYT